MDYLLKPASEEELIAVMDEALRLISEGGRNEIGQAGMQEFLNNENESMEEIRVGSFQRSILEFVQKHYQEDISLQDIAHVSNYSDAYFCKLFKQCFDKNFTTYLTELRVEKAKQLLKDMAVNVKEISELVGYRDSNYFTKVFKRMAGVTPSEYRMMLQRMQNTS